MHRIVAALTLLVFATPAAATGEMACRTAGPRPIEVSVGFGHMPGAPLIAAATRLVDNGRPIAVSAPQWWLDGSEFRLLLADPSGMRREAIVKTRRNGGVYDGSLWRGGQRRWIRCRG